MIQEVGESSDSYWSSNPTDVFNIGLTSLDLAQENSWILDFGCSKHITGNPDLFSNLEPHPTQAVVQMAGNQLLPVDRKENVRLNLEAEININEVYFVPGLSFNLISVGSIADMEYILVFDDKSYTIYHNNKVVGKGIRDEKIGLYKYLVSQSKLLVSQSNFSICAVNSIPVPQL